MPEILTSQKDAAAAVTAAAVAADKIQGKGLGGRGAPLLPAAVEDEKMPETLTSQEDAAAAVVADKIQGNGLGDR